MPPKKINGEAGAVPALVSNGKAMNDAEMRFLTAVMTHMTTKPEVDWSNVATMMSLKDGKCARERYRQIKVKYGWNHDGASTSESGPGSIPSPSKVGKKAASAAAKGPITPSKVTKRRNSKGKTGGAAADHNDDDGQDELNMKDEDMDAGDDDETQTPVKKPVASRKNDASKGGAKNPAPAENVQVATADLDSVVKHEDTQDADDTVPGEV